MKDTEHPQAQELHAKAREGLGPRKVDGNSKNDYLLGCELYRCRLRPTSAPRGRAGGWWSMSGRATITALMLALLSSSCVTSVADGPAKQYAANYAQVTTVCVVRFSDRRNNYTAPCANGDTLVATGYTVDPIRGDCEPALMALHGFRQTWGCVQNYRERFGEHDGEDF